MPLRKHDAGHECRAGAGRCTSGESERANREPDWQLLDARAHGQRLTAQNRDRRGHSDQSQKSGSIRNLRH